MKVVQILVQMIFGVIVGGVVSYQTVPIAASCKILYVSQDEIMDLENKRVAKESLNERQVFYGKIEKAVKLATTIPRSYQNRTTKVVYSEAPVQGEGVRSISKEVHEKIIQELQEELSHEK
jgi:hypothetical protein